VVAPEVREAVELELRTTVAVVETVEVLFVTTVPLVPGRGEGVPVGASMVEVEVRVVRAVDSIMEMEMVPDTVAVSTTVTLVLVGMIGGDSSPAAAQSAFAAVRTAIAWSPQAVKTQVVAAVWILSLFSAVHWHARSEMAQVVSLVVAASMQGLPQAGMVL